jgi:hypothetical protein
MLRKFFIVFILLLVTPTLFIGCKNKNDSNDNKEKESVSEEKESNNKDKDGDEDTNDVSALDQIKGYKEMAKLSEAMSSGNEKDAVTAMQNLAEIQKKYDLQEFEEAESLEIPTSFPSNLIYKDSKATSVSDNSVEPNVNLNITLKTVDVFNDVKNFYKEEVKKDWKITSQSSEGNSYSVDGEKEGGYSISVNVNSDDFSALTSIDISYYYENYDTGDGTY